MDEKGRTKYAIKQLSDWWFDLSKLALGSMILPVVFEDWAMKFKMAGFAFGLIFFVTSAGFGFEFAQKIKNNHE